MDPNTLKALQGAAGTGSSEIYVEDVFSNYLYRGNDTAGRDIVNNIDLAGEGGMIWSKNRSSSGKGHSVTDTVGTGSGKYLETNATDALGTASRITDFNSNGYELGDDDVVNGNGDNYHSYTFRKCPGFFDIVKFTGTGSSQSIAHNLGCVPGMIWVKKLTGTGSFFVYHKSGGNDVHLLLDGTPGWTPSAAWDDTTPTSTHFTVLADDVNKDDEEFVAYLFADGDDSDAQVFGDNGDQSIIKVGQYTGNGSTNGPKIDLGWEPQLLIIKKSTDQNTYDSWHIKDFMKHPEIYLIGQSNGSEPGADPSSKVDLLADGFHIRTSDGAYNTSSAHTYMYVAIRRGPMKTPETGSEVFAPIASDSPGTTAQRPEKVDMMWFGKRGGWNDMFQVADRVRGFQNVTSLGDDSSTSKWFKTSGSEMEGASGGAIVQYSDSVDGPFVTAASSGSNFINYFFKRAPGFFDVISYTGVSDSPRDGIYHNLGVAPELIFFKRRDYVKNWYTYVAPLGTQKHLYLDGNDSVISESDFIPTTPTATLIPTDSYVQIDNEGSTYMAYAFASCPGVSKIGSFDGTGSNQDIDCGFTAGARFIIIKRTDADANWFVWDTARGIVSGSSDPYLQTDYSGAEGTGDYIDPLNAGFTITTDASGINASGGEYIYFAIS